MNAEESVPLISDTEHIHIDVFSQVRPKRQGSHVLTPTITIENECTGASKGGIGMDLVDLVDGEAVNIQKLLLETKENRDLNYIQGLPEGKDAHFFVSYNSEDSDRVLSIVAKLEKVYGVACIIHERDFQAGMNIHENIEKGMRRSMKILMFLSKTFLKSSYCMLEKNLASEMSMESGENNIIPIMLEECSMPSYLKTLTYIDGKGEDVANRIIAAYSSADPDIVPDTFSESTLRNMENGFFVCLCYESEKSCFCRPKLKKFVFDDYTKHRLRQAKMQVCDEVIEKVIDIANSYMPSAHWYRLDESVCCSFACCIWILIVLTLICLWGLIALTFYDGHATNKTTNVQTGITIAYPAVAAFVWFPLWCVLYRYDRRRKEADVSRLNEDIFIYGTMKTYHDGVVFKVFGGLNYRLPTIMIIRYDVKPCTMYLANKMKQFLKDTYGNEASDSITDYEIKADIFIQSKLQRLIDTDHPDAPVNRHFVKGGRSCFCQVLEGSVEQHVMARIEEWRSEEKQETKL